MIKNPIIALPKNKLKILGTDYGLIIDIMQAIQYNKLGKKKRENFTKRLEKRLWQIKFDIENDRNKEYNSKKYNLILNKVYAPLVFNGVD